MFELITVEAPWIVHYVGFWLTGAIIGSLMFLTLYYLFSIVFGKVKR